MVSLHRCSYYKNRDVKISFIKIFHVICLHWFVLFSHKKLSIFFVHRVKKIFTDADAFVRFCNRNEIKLSWALPKMSWLLPLKNNSMTCTWYFSITPARNISKLSKIPLTAWRPVVFWKIFNIILGVIAKYHYKSCSYLH